MTDRNCKVSLLDHESAKLAASKLGIQEGMARLSIFQALLAHPKVARPFNDLLMTLLFEGLLPVRLRELVILRTGWVTNCAYEWTQHYSIAQMLGVEVQAIECVIEWRSQEPDFYSAQEQTALQCVDEFAKQRNFSEQSWELIRKNFTTDEEIVELVLLINTYFMISGFLQSLDIPLEEGVSPWPPTGKGPE